MARKIIWATGTAFAGTVIGGLTVKLLTSVAISALQQALTPSQQGGGVTIATTLRGEDNPETVILGRYATAGQCVYVNSHGKSRRNLTHVVEICSAPGATLNRLMLGDTWVTIGTSPRAGFEGYGLPVVEAMYKGVPVLARSTGGVPEAMDGAGVLFDEASPAELAALMARLISDAALRSEVLASQQARIRRLLARPVQDEFRNLLAALPADLPAGGARRAG